MPASAVQVAPGVPEPVTGEVVEAELCYEVVPVRRVADGGGGEDAAAWPAQERVVGLLAVVRRSRTGSSASSIGTGRSLRPLVRSGLAEPARSPRHLEHPEAHRQWADHRAAPVSHMDA